MKRLLCFLIVVIVAVSACADPEAGLFYSTQERVCAEPDYLQSYDFSEWAKDTGIVIPGLRQNFVPQGVCVWKEKGWILISGYYQPLAGTESAAVFAVDASDGKMVGEYTLIDGAGRELGGHFSGVTVTETDLYVTGGYSLYRIPLREFARVGQKGALLVAQELPLSVSADCCYFGEEMLWVCEYYQPDAYPLKGTHITLCRDGTRQYAWMVGYALTKQGLDPLCVFSMPDQIQGISWLTDGRLFISRSYGRKNPSQLSVFRDPRTAPPNQMVEMDGITVPLWNLDSRWLLRNMNAPPMAEGCCAMGEGLYLLFESAAYYYRSLDPNNRSVHPTDTVWYLEINETEHRN